MANMTVIEPKLVNTTKMTLITIRGVQICQRLKSYDRFTRDFTRDFLPIIDEIPLVSLWLSIFESLVHTRDLFPMIGRKSLVKSLVNL